MIASCACVYEISAGTLALAIASVPISAGHEGVYDTVLYPLNAVVLALAGALISSRQRTHPIGWILLGMGVAQERILFLANGIDTEAFRPAMSPERLVFASEQRAIVQSGLITASVDIGVARRLLIDAFGIEGSERTLCNQIRRLQGGQGGEAT